MDAGVLEGDMDGVLEGDMEGGMEGALEVVGLGEAYRRNQERRIDFSFLKCG
jgi:hypothetical protein